jgi:hypothetical protein
MSVPDAALWSQEFSPASVFAWQQDGVVRDVELDLVERKVGKRQVLVKYGATVAVLAGKRRGLVGLDPLRPELAITRFWNCWATAISSRSQ